MNDQSLCDGRTIADPSDYSANEHPNHPLKIGDEPKIVANTSVPLQRLQDCCSPRDKRDKDCEQQMKDLVAGAKASTSNVSQPTVQ